MDCSRSVGPAVPATVNCSLSRFWPLFLPGLLVAAGLPALAIDCPLARWCMSVHCPGEVSKLLGFTEVFGHGLGVLLIVLVIYQLDPLRCWALPRVLAASLGSGLAADMIKMLVVRTRPHCFDFQGGVLASFGGWFPLARAGSDGQSFPSAHTATAAGLAIALVWLYPRGRWLFPAMAVLVACQRIQTGAHFLSDTLCGGAVGCLVAAACLWGGPMARRFDRWEREMGAAGYSRRSS